MEPQTTEDPAKAARQAKRMEALYEEARDTYVKTPDLEGYFERQASGKSPIDNLSGVDYEKAVEDEELQRIQEAQGDEESYRKELLARLFGGKLTARQYAVFMNMSDSQQEQAKLEHAAEEKFKHEAKDLIRNAEELLESRRRQKVHAGEWTEQNSHSALQ